MGAAAVRTVFKYPIRNASTPTVLEPLRCPQIVHVGHDPAGTFCVWVQHELEGDRDTRLSVQVHGTGHHITDPAVTHAWSTVDGPFVWHVYAKPLYDETSTEVQP